MEKWQVFQSKNEQAAVVKIQELENDGYAKEDISILAKHPHRELEKISEQTDVTIEKPVNDTAFGIISGILQSLSGGLVIPQVYTPDYGALYAAGPFAKWFSHTDDKSVKRLLRDFDLTEPQIEELIQGLDAGNILILVR